MKLKVVLFIMVILAIATIVYATVYIPKGSKLYCLNCNEWLATSKRDLFESKSITLDMFDSVWEEIIFPQDFRCPKCRYVMYPEMIMKCNWVLTSNKTIDAS